MKVIRTDKNGDEIAEVSVTELDTMFKEIRAKSIEEFADRLKAEYKPCEETDAEIYEKVCNRIDKIAEEMRGAG